MLFSRRFTGRSSNVVRNGSSLVAPRFQESDPARSRLPEIGDEYEPIGEGTEEGTFNGVDRSFVMEVVTISGRAASVEFRFAVAAVEIWHHEQCCAVFDRDELRSWLADPGQGLRQGSVEFCVDRTVDRTGRVALSLADVNTWTLSPAALEDLRACL